MKGATVEAFSYVQCNDAKTALAEVTEHNGAKYVAGGTTLIDLMKLHVENPARLVDVNRLPLAEIKVTDDAIEVGAMVRNSDLAYHETVKERCPVLSEALLSGATAQIRNVATVGGNLLQRTRCTYFRDPAWPCNQRKPGSGCAAIDGYNRSHALLGTSEKCIATHPSDMCVALVALDAVVKATGAGGERSIPMMDFHVAYGADPARLSVLQPGEMILGVEIPRRDWFRRSHYLKVRDRASFEFALVSVATALEIKDGAIASARIAFGGIATRPWRALEAEKALIGVKPGEDPFRQAAEAALTGAKSYRFNGFKIALAKKAIVRALSTVAAMA